MTEARSVIRQFAEVTSLHGLPRIAKSRSTSIRLLWLTVFLASLSVFGYYSYNIIKRYVAHETRIHIDIDNEAVPMPEITLCNKQGISDVNRYTLINKLLPYWYTKAITLLPTSLLDDVTSALHEYMTSVLPLAFAKESHLKFFDRERVTSTLEMQNVMDLAPSVNMTLIRCMYQNKPCQLHIRENFNSAFYKCFTLQLLQDNHPLHISSWGPKYGVVLTLFGGMNPTLSDFPQIEDNAKLDRFLQNFPGIHDREDPESGTEGFKLVVHPVGQTSFPQQEALSVSTNAVTTMAITYSRMSRMGTPYGECTLDALYTVHRCRTQCLQANIKKTCNCTDMSLYVPSISNQTVQVVDQGPNTEETPKQNNPETTLKGTTQPELDHPVTQNVACYNYTSAVSKACNQSRNGVYPLARLLCDGAALTRMMSQLDDCVKLTSAADPDSCNCPPSCQEQIYSIQQHTTQLQSGVTEHMIDVYRAIKSHQQELLPLLESRMPNGSSLKSNHDVAPFLVKHMAVVNLYMADTKVVTVAESPAYSEEEMVADLGGMLGLCIGLSFITIIELVELMIQLCVRQCKKEDEVQPQEAQSRNTASTQGTATSQSEREGLGQVEFQNQKHSNTSF